MVAELHMTYVLGKQCDPQSPTLVDTFLTLERKISPRKGTHLFVFPIVQQGLSRK